MTTGRNDEQKGWLAKLLGGLLGKETKSDPKPASSSPTSTPPASPAPSPPRRTDTTLDLDISAFVPASRDEIIQSTRGQSWFGNVWFGRRDLIPPADDPRTLLVDRAMVAQGFLTPEQLVEIHRVGKEMDFYRPDQLVIAEQSRQAGQAAVDQMRAERARIKAKKRAEAAAKKQARREAIAHRRENDIVFLGRGVSGHLGHRTSDLAKLEQLGLPRMSTPADVAQALSLSIKQLRWLAFHQAVAKRTHYFHFAVPKKSGGTRQLSAPHRLLAATQRWILTEILEKLETEPAAMGFVRGRNIVSNARPHVGKAFVMNMDLENFFPSISFARVRHLFHRLGYSGCVATILALLCTESPRRLVQFGDESFEVATGKRGLPQGACTSPAISNQIARRLDRRLSGLARKMHLDYSRYADDLTFSGASDSLPRVGYLMARVRHIAEDEGFAVNQKKTRVHRRNTSQRVTGLVVNDKPSISRKRIKQIRSILHRAQYEGLDAQNRQHHPAFRSWLEGMIAFLAMTRPELASKFRQQLANLK